MKISAASLHARQQAFTLVEAMVATGVFMLLIGSIVMCNLFGISMAARQQIWLGASEDSARAVSTLMGDIRSAQQLEIGSYSAGTFTQDGTTVQQSGNALLIYPTTNTTYPWTLYYYNSTSNYLIRTNYNGPGLSGDYQMVSANQITNDLSNPIFTEVDYTGTPLSNATPVASVSIYLSFISLQNQQIKIQSGSSVDMYQINITASPRIRL